MKKIMMIAAGAAMMFGVVSCNKESETVNNATMYVSTYSLATRTGMSPVVSLTRYAVYVDFTTMKSTVSTDNLNIGGSAIGFKTAEMDYKAGYTAALGENQRRSFAQMQGTDVTTQGSMPITNMNCQLTYAAVNNDTQLVNQLKNELQQNPIAVPNSLTREGSIYVYMQYKLGDTLVRTFWTDMMYTGTTTTTYPQATEPYTTDKITYRVVMKQNATGSRLADVYFYNAKFADSDKAPSLNFVLKDLPLTFGDYGFKIEAQNVNPVMANTPNTKYVFNNISITSTTDMAGMTCDYQVAGVYRGSFSGKTVFPAK